MKKAYLISLIKKYENTYPMTGKPDKEAAYKNGWYDCAYSIRKEIENENKRLQKTL
jgi:hypothetical protein